ncbi:DUF4238 domain-containing protein [Lactococcus muris]|uniref:DUF4238 domain-containing protein n=1 Tax=Lactococcus muris TaxID=2941330 RepID=A0ABV4D6G6_9LACT
MTEKKRQHIVPQHLQRNFAIDKQKRIVKIYLVQQREFHEAPIERTLKSSYFYGKSGEVETILSNEIETPGSRIIAEMIKNPKKFMRKHKILDEGTLKYFSTLRNRSLAVVDVLDDVNEQIMKKWEISANYDDFQKSLRKEFQEKMLDTNEMRGKAVLLEPNEICKEKIYNGRYMLVEVEKQLFFSDVVSTSVFPLSPNLLLVIGEMTDIFKVAIRMKSKAAVVNFLNYRSIKEAKKLVLVGNDTSIEDIERLERRFQKY